MNHFRLSAFVALAGVSALLSSGCTSVAVEGDTAATAQYELRTFKGAISEGLEQTFTATIRAADAHGILRYAERTTDKQKEIFGRAAKNKSTHEVKIVLKPRVQTAADAQPITDVYITFGWQGDLAESQRIFNRILKSF